jgi:hypothetical protein
MEPEAKFFIHVDFMLPSHLLSRSIYFLRVRKLSLSRSPKRILHAGNNFTSSGPFD